MGVPGYRISSRYRLQLEQGYSDLRKHLVLKYQKTVCLRVHLACRSFRVQLVQGVLDSKVQLVQKPKCTVSTDRIKYKKFMIRDPWDIRYSIQDTRFWKQNRGYKIQDNRIEDTDL